MQQPDQMAIAWLVVMVAVAWVLKRHFGKSTDRKPRSKNSTFYKAVMGPQSERTFDPHRVHPWDRDERY